MEVRMTNQCDGAIIIPDGLRLNPGETREVGASPYWYLDESFRLRIRYFQTLVGELREVTNAHLRIGSKLMSARV